MKIHRILIDGRFVGVGDSVSRTTLETLKAVLKLDKTNDYTLLIRPAGEQEVQKSNIKSQNDNLQIKILNIPHYSLAEQTTLLKYLNQEKFDLVHFMQFNHPIRYRGKFIVNILDLTLFGHLYRKNKLKGLAFNRVMKSAVKNSEKIITVSKTSKKDIVDTYGIDPNKVAVTYLGIDPSFNLKIENCKLKIENVMAKYGITSHYILYTGMWKRHKNILRMLEAFEEYKSQDTRNPSTSSGPHCGKIQTNHNIQIQNIQLVLAGKIDKNEPEVTEMIQKINNHFCHPEPIDCAQGRRGAEGSFDSQERHPPISSRAGSELAEGSPNGNNLAIQQYNNNLVLATGFVDEADLPYLYAGALAYCIPSLSEGFGLPPLEAMACGTPVISSNLSAMPEILGDAPLYFDPYSVEDIKNAMVKIISDEKLRSELSKKGLEQAKKYSWDKTGERTLETYNEVLNQ